MGRRGKPEAQQEGSRLGGHSASEHAGFRVGVLTTFLAHLFWGHLSIFIEIHVFKQAGGRVLVPHKQVACGQAILSGYQLHLKHQDSATRDTPG